MSRWRDIKQGKNESEIEETSSVKSFKPCASVSARLKAFATDTFLITTPILYIVIYLIMGSGEEFAQNKGNGWMIIIGINLLIIVGFWLKSGQTPGLKAYSLKLVKVSSEQKVGFFQAISRYILTLLSIMSIILMFIPFIRKDKRTFQDLFSNSFIITE